MVAASLVANVVLVALMGLGLEGAALSTVAVQVLGAAVLLTLISKDAGGNSTNVRLRACLSHTLLSTSWLTELALASR